MLNINIFNEKNRFSRFQYFEHSILKDNFISFDVMSGLLNDELLKTDYFKFSDGSNINDQNIITFLSTNMNHYSIYSSPDIYKKYKKELNCKSFSKEYSFILDKKDKDFKNLKNKMNKILPERYNIIKQNEILKTSVKFPKQQKDKSIL